jgi:hypothetical protein
MNDSQNNTVALDVLGGLLRLLCRGLPVYLLEVRPWVSSADESLSKALARLVDDRRLYAGHVAQAILSRGGYPDPGPFPLKFTGLNDVSLEYLARTLHASLRADMEILQSYSRRLEEMPRLHALSEEILGNTRGHAEILENVIKDEG